MQKTKEMFTQAQSDKGTSLRQGYGLASRGTKQKEIQRVRDRQNFI